MKILVKKHLLLLSILLLAGVLRMFNLDAVPPGITNDEVSAVYNAFTLATTGKDLGNQPLFKAIFIVPPNYPQAEFPAIFLAPFFKFVNLTLLTARLPSALIGVLSCFFLYLIINRLTSSFTLALTSSFAMAVSPWHIHVSRTIFDSPLSLFFLLTGLVFMLYAKKSKLIFSALLFILAFLSYQGTKLTAIPFLLLTIWLNWSIRNKRKYMLIVLGLTIAFMASFILFFIKYSPASIRLSEIDIFNIEATARIINEERSVSLLSTTVTYLFSNKAVTLAKHVLDRFLNLFSPEFLFLRGEQRAAYSLWFHGVLYSIEFFFMLLGFAQLYQTHKRILIWASLLIFIGSLPSLLSTVGQSYVFRSLLVTPAFYLLIGSGLTTASKLAKQLPKRVIIVTVLTLLYGLSISNYLVIYHSRYPVYSASGFFLSDRILASYLRFVPKDQKVYIRVPEPEKHYLQFAFYGNLKPIQIQKTWNRQEYIANNLIFTDKCPEQTEDIYIIYHKDRYPCFSAIKKKASQIKLTDAFRNFIIENDKICNNYALPMRKYNLPKSLEAFRNIGKETKAQLCKRWFFID